MTVAAEQCPICDRLWPTRYCPCCLETTIPIEEANPIDSAEAKKIAARYAEFHRRYLDYDNRREGPTPERLGAQDARDPSDRDRKILELDRTFREREAA